MTQEDKFDYNLILTFLWQIRLFEEKLKEAGFRKIGKPNEADWTGFVGMVRAGEIEIRPDDEEIMTGAMLCLLEQPVQGRGRYNVHEISQVAEVLQERGRQFMSYAGVKNFSDEDFELMVAGLVVMSVWSAALGNWLNGNRPV